MTTILLIIIAICVAQIAWQMPRRTGVPRWLKLYSLWMTCLVGAPLIVVFVVVMLTH